MQMRIIRSVWRSYVGRNLLWNLEWSLNSVARILSRGIKIYREFSYPSRCATKILPRVVAAILNFKYAVNKCEVWKRELFETARSHKRTGTFVLSGGAGGRGGGLVTILPEKNYTKPESAIVVQMHPNRSKTKTFTTLTSNWTVIIPKMVILKPHILYDLDRQTS